MTRLQLGKLCAFLLAATGMACTRPTVLVQPKEAGSDERAAEFRRDWLPRMMVDAGQNFNTESVARDFSRLAFDPSRLVVLEPTAVRVYFIASQGGFQSALGYYLEGIDIEDPGPFIVFPNASSPKKLFEYADTISREPGRQDRYEYGGRRPDAPVLPGDFIDLGVLPANTQIVFFLDANAAVGAPRGRFTTIPERNPDRIQHVVTVAYQDSPYLMLAFEDLMGGGDRTFNDIVFTVELSKSTIQALSDARKQQEVEALLRTMARRKVIRARIITGTSVAIVVGGPFLIWMLRRYLHRRYVRRAYARAQALLEEGNPREALKMIRDGQRYGISKKFKGRWSEIEVSACKQLNDAAYLEDVFDRDPDAVLKDETASLMVARTQLETDRDAFHTLRGAWLDRETQPWTWLTLESDLLVRQDKPHDAEVLLREKQFDGVNDAARLARLSERVWHAAPADAQQLLAHALQLAPDNPEVHRSRASILERAGQRDKAEEAWRTAAKLADHDPFHRDHFAEFCIRCGDFGTALASWREVLTPPTADTIWLKALFWERVAGPATVSWKSLEMPTGPLRPLLKYLLDVPGDRFWTSDTADALAAYHPQAFSRPECFWLRLVEGLRQRREENVLALLATTRSDSRHYLDSLEIALRQALTFRRMQFLNPAFTIVGHDTPPAWAPPLFGRLDAWAHGTLPEDPSDLAALLSGPGAFVEILRSVGWKRAAETLRTQGVSGLG